MSTFLAQQFDYLLFLGSLASLLLAAISFMLWESGKKAPSWWALGLFFLTHGQANWLEMHLDTHTLQHPLFYWSVAGLHALGLFLAARFAQTLLAARWHAALRWLPWPFILAVAGAGVLRGPSVLTAASSYALCLPAAVLAGTALIRFSRRSSPNGWLAAAGAVLIFSGASRALPLLDPSPILLLLPGLLSIGGALALMEYATRREGASRLRRYPRLALGTLALITGLGWVLTEHFGRDETANIHARLDGDAHLLVQFVAGALQMADGAARALPGLIGPRGLLARGDADAARRTNIALDNFALGLGGGVVYLMDAGGTVVATSNRDAPDSFVGQNYAFRPYFQQSMAGRHGSYFARGITSGEPGYYASHPVSDARGVPLGVAVIKLPLEPVESAMRNFKLAFLVDPHGVAFLSSHADWRMRALWPLDETARQALLASRQFDDLNTRPVLAQEVKDRSELTLKNQPYLAVRLPIGLEGWSVLLFRSTDTIRTMRLQGMSTAAFLGMLALALLTLLQRESAARGRIEQQHVALHKLSRELHHLATADPLTGVCNRRHFDQTLAQEMERALRYGQPLTLIMFDIDHFKRVNDNYGHAAGDDLLVALSAFVNAHLRDTDLLARWGGEEFMLIAPNTGIEAATQLAEKLRALIEHGDFGTIGAITSSFGVTQFEAGDTPDSFTNRADAAMYRAKESGRNRVCRSDAVPP